MWTRISSLILLSVYCFYLLCLDVSTAEKPVVAISFEASLKTLAAFMPNLENSLELSFVCCNAVLNNSILAETALFVSLVTDITLSAKLLITVPYVSAIPFGDIDQ